MTLAWITGAGQGIGRAVALELVKRGWVIAASARTVSDLDQLATDAAALGGVVHPFPLDVTDRAAVADTVTRIEKEIGSIDLAFLNAGTYVRFGVEDFKAADVENQFAINVIGTANCLEPVLTVMRGRGAGHIAVVSSLTAYRGLPMASAYGGSKAALTNMCEALKPELDQEGIDLTVVHPGFVKTPLTDQNEFPMPFLVQADKAASWIAKGLERRQFEIAFPWRFVVWLKLARMLPYRLYLIITKRLVER